MNAVTEKSTTMQELRKSVAAGLPAVSMGFETAQGFDLMQRGAKLLASSSLVPKEYQGNLPNCVIALNMANRIGADPLLVMQNLYVVHGRPGWSAKFLIACFNQCERFSAIRFEWSGDRNKDNWGCRAWAIEKETQQKVIGALITIELAKKEGWYEKTGSKWKTIPEQMLMYRSAAWLVNTHAPEISMGLSTTDELVDVYDATPDANGKFQVTTADLAAVDKVVGESQTGAPNVSFEILRARIEKASDVDVLDIDADLIGQIDGIEKQDELCALYHEKRVQLMAKK